MSHSKAVKRSRRRRLNFHTCQALSVFPRKTFSSLSGVVADIEIKLFFQSALFVFGGRWKRFQVAEKNASHTYDTCAVEKFSSTKTRIGIGGKAKVTNRVTAFMCLTRRFCVRDFKYLILFRTNMAPKVILRLVADICRSKLDVDTGDSISSNFSFSSCAKELNFRARPRRK